MFGVDFSMTFALVTRLDTIRMLLFKEMRRSIFAKKILAWFKAGTKGLVQ